MSNEEIKAAIVKCFDSPAGRIALAELEQFAAANDENFIADPRQADFYAGRRSMITHIKNFLTQKDK